METEIKTGKIRLVATEEKFRKSPMFIAPAYNDVKKLFIIGKKQFKAKQNDTDENLWEYHGEAEEEGVYLSNYEQFEVSDKRELDLSDPIDRIIYEIILSSASEYIAPNKKSVNPKYHRLYIEDKETESNEFVDEVNDIFTAGKMVQDMKETELRDLARILKVHEKGVSKQIVLANVFRVIKSTPTKVLKIINSPSYKTDAIRTLLIDGQMIRKTAKGYYTNSKENPEFIAYQEADLASFIINTKNTTLITQWTRQAKNFLKEAETEI